jgi:hypothetical protein
MPTNTLPFTTSGAPVVVSPKRLDGKYLSGERAMIKATKSARFLDMLGVFAEFETNLRRGRQMEGMAAAKLRGVYKGRPASIDAAKVAALKAEGFAKTVSVTMRQTHVAGERLVVDYAGDGVPVVIDRLTGEIRADLRRGIGRVELHLRQGDLDAGAAQLDRRPRARLRGERRRSRVFTSTPAFGRNARSYRPVQVRKECCYLRSFGWRTQSPPDGSRLPALTNP